MLQSTDEIKSAYTVDTGDAYLEWLLFNYGRYLLASSSCGVSIQSAMTLLSLSVACNKDTVTH